MTAADLAGKLTFRHKSTKVDIDSGSTGTTLPTPARHIPNNRQAVKMKVIVDRDILRDVSLDVLSLELDPLLQFPTSSGSEHMILYNIDSTENPKARARLVCECKVQTRYPVDY